MCGIFAAILSKPSKEVFHNAMLHLRYRGYDSWGFSFENSSVKSIEPYNNDILNILDDVSRGVIHTRWATNGKVSLPNTHPIEVRGYSIVHNGIMTNCKYYVDKFNPRVSDTDTEVLLNLFIDGRLIDAGGDFAFIVKTPMGRIIGYRQGNTQLYLVIDRENSFFTSDINALPPGEYEYCLLQDGKFYDLEDLSFSKDDRVYKVIISVKQIHTDESCVTLSELRESNDVLERLCQEQDLYDYNQPNPVFIGSGSSYHAGLFAKYLMDEDCTTIIPTEFKWKPTTIPIFISQSGESRDIVAADYRKDYRSLVITNNTKSTLATLTGGSVLDMKCGVEKAVGATKSFIASCYILACIAGKKYEFSHEIKQSLIEQSADHKLETILKAKHIFILGSGYNYPIALEGALKFKELALTYCEGFQTTEFKHGPLALTDDASLAIIIGKGKKELIAAEQIKARGGKVMWIENDHPFSDMYEIQYLAIKAALAKNINPDFPRNLAKSITVE